MKRRMSSCRLREGTNSCCERRNETSISAGARNRVNCVKPWRLLCAFVRCPGLSRAGTATTAIDGLRCLRISVTPGTFGNTNFKYATTACHTNLFFNVIQSYITAEIETVS